MRSNGTLTPQIWRSIPFLRRSFRARTSQAASVRVKRAPHSQLHVALVGGFRPQLGGAERAVENLAKELIRKGVGIAVLVRHFAGLSRFETIKGVPVYRLGISGPRIVNSPTYILHSFLWLVVRGQRFSVVDVQSVDSQLLVGLLAKIFGGRRLVVTLQGERTIIHKKATLAGRLRVLAMSRVGDGFVAVSEETRRQFIKEGIAPKRIYHIPNGVDTERFALPTQEKKLELREALGYCPEDRVVLYAGRLASLKRVDALLRAFECVRVKERDKCLIVGDGPRRAPLESLARELGLQGDVRFTGPVADTSSYYQVADVFVLPSLYEGLSMALLEAMACGLAVIVADSAGNLQVVKDGVTGLTFPVASPSLLDTPLARLLSKPKLQASLGGEARSFVARHCSIETVGRRRLAMYAELAGTELR